MTDLDVRAQAAPSLQAVPGPQPLQVVPGPQPLQVVPGLQPLLADAVVCDGDSCFVPGAEGDWSEVPD